MSHADKNSGKELVSPRITTEYLKSLLTHVEYKYFAETRTMVCTARCVNNYSITTTVVCPNTEMFEEEACQRRAFNKVIDELRTLEYYVLFWRLHEHKQSAESESNGN